MRLWTGAALTLLLLVHQATPATPQAPLEDDVRAAVREYYDAQAARDPDRAAAFWSAAANPRMTRDAFIAVFGEPSEDSFTLELRAVEVKGTDARVRLSATRIRLVTRQVGLVTLRNTFVNSQLWRKEAGAWKLLRDGPFAEEIADELIAALRRRSTTSTAAISWRRVSSSRSARRWRSRSAAATPAAGSCSSWRSRCRAPPAIDPAC